MKLTTITLALAALLATPLAAQTGADEYLDYYIVKVKPEKRADFDAVARKIADANRKNNGDNWLAYQVEYGENHTVYFVSSRKNMAAIDTALDMFRKAAKEAFGANAENVFHEIDAAVISSRGELRRRRWDLSLNVAGAEDMSKRLGEARWIRTTAIRVRPGHVGQFEELSKLVNEATNKRDPGRAVTVTQSVAGQTGTTFYATSLSATLGGFDTKGPSLKEALGEEGYAKYRTLSAEAVLGTETMISRFLPDLSNPTEAVVNVSRDFWTPKGEVIAARANKRKKANEKP